MIVHDDDLIWREAVIERLTRIEARMVPRDEIIALRTGFDVLQKQLGGNGQPGTCREHAEAIIALGERMQGLERKQSWMTGIGIGISAAISAGMAYLGIK
jgi:hypothetical protein